MGMGEKPLGYPDRQAAQQRDLSWGLRLAGWCWSWWVDSILQGTAFCRLPSRAVLLSSRMMETKMQVPLRSDVLPSTGYSLSTISRRQRPQILETIRLLQTAVVIRGDFRSLSSPILPWRWHHCTPVLPSAGRKQQHKSAEGLKGRLWPLRSGTGEPSWSCDHRNGVAGMENMVLAHQQAHQPDRGAGVWLGRGQSRTYSLRAVSHSPQTAGCIITVTETWVKHDHSEVEWAQRAGAPCPVVLPYSKGKHTGEQQVRRDMAQHELDSFFLPAHSYLPASLLTWGIAVVWSHKATFQKAAVLWGGAHNVPAARWSHSHSSGKGRGWLVWKDQDEFLFKWKPEGEWSQAIFTASTHTALGGREGVFILNEMGRTARAIWGLACWWRSRWGPEQKHPVSFTSIPALQSL